MIWIVILFWVLALVHIAPAFAGIAPKSLSRLYGVDGADKSLLVLLQHRAILFGLLGAGLAIAPFMSGLRWPVLVAAFISMVAFIAIAFVHGQTRGPLARIAVIDAAALLPAGILAYLLSKG